MKLLIITQKVDAADDVLGFFYHWIREFSRHVEEITVICLEEGAHDFQSNVRVLSLGKEKKRSRMQYLGRFFQNILRERKRYDTVFVHMNPEYVVLGGILWRMLGKRIGFWYVHRNVDLKLWLAEKLAHIIFSTTPEAFRLRSLKVQFIGHGVNFFQFERKKIERPAGAFRILHVGRITPIKNLDTLIEALGILKKSWDKPFKVRFLGRQATLRDQKYKEDLEALIENYDLKDEIILWNQKVPFPNTLSYYQEADVSVNLTPTGGMDKAVLESIASGTLPLSANKAFRNLFGKYANHLLYNERDAEDTANKIMAIGDMDLSERRKIEEYLYGRARARFDLNVLVKRIVGELQIT